VNFQIQGCIGILLNTWQNCIISCYLASPYWILQGACAWIGLFWQLHICNCHLFHSLSNVNFTLSSLPILVMFEYCAFIYLIINLISLLKYHVRFYASVSCQVSGSHSLISASKFLFKLQILELYLDAHLHI